MYYVRMFMLGLIKLLCVEKNECGCMHGDYLLSISILELSMQPEESANQMNAEPYWWGLLVRMRKRLQGRFIPCLC